MEEELQRPAKEKQPDRRSAPAASDDGMPESIRDALYGPERERREPRKGPIEVASPLEREREQRNRPLFVPSDPHELPVIRQDTVYACITSDALAARGERKPYPVPDGFVGMLMDVAGRGETLLMPGEEATGNFILHLFRTGTLLAKHHTEKLVTADGFEASADTQFSMRLSGSDTASLKDFVRNEVQGKSHLSMPVLKGGFDRPLREGLKKFVGRYDVQALLDKPDRAAAELAVLAELRGHSQDSGVRFLGLDALKFASRDLERQQREAAEARREAERERQRQEFEAVAMREQVGDALTRADLSEVLDSIQERRAAARHEEVKARHQRERELAAFEREYKAEANNLEAALRKMMAHNELEIDRLKFEEYLKMTAEVRERLAEDRIEFYINQIRDERLKADLIRRLIEKDMTPEQLKEIASLERARSGRTAQAPEPQQQTSQQAAAEQTEAAVERQRPDETDDEAVWVSAEADESSDVSREMKLEPGPVVPVDEEFSVSQSQSAVRSSFSRPQPLPEEAVVDTPKLIQRFPLPMGSAIKLGLETLDDEQAPMAGGLAQTPWQPEVARDSEAPEVRAVSEEESEDSPLPELRTILLVGGRSIFASHVSADGRASELTTFLNLADGPLGSLRSVRSVELNGRRTLLVGARRGLYSVDMESRRWSAYPIEAAFNPLTGINAAIAWQGKFYATHSQFGLLRWSAATPGASAERHLTETTDRAKAVRSLFLDAGYWPTFACGDHLLAMEHDRVPRIVATYTGAPAGIVMATGTEGHFYAACEDGSIIVWDKTEPHRPERRARTRDPISGATISSDGRSIVICTRAPQIRVYNMEAGTLARYDAPQPMRFAREYGRYLFGFSRNRSAMYLWDSFGDGQPKTEVPLPDACHDLVGL